ncbi:GAF domain-containing protein [Candidatus Leptofilum sp.]|uniref:GAF domain-containing protein n=1 Tax=Candidatus Leptofilum sp. TaxID=3241576 RepID=UPI003B5A8DEE
MFTAPSARPQALGALREIARALSTAWDLDTTLNLIVQKTTEVMHVDSCTIYLLDPDGRTLRLRASTGLASRAVGRATLNVGEGMTGFAVESNEPIFARDAQHDPHFKLVDEAEETPFISLLAVPLHIEANLIGAMNVQTRTPHDFNANEVALLSLIGDIAAGALAKAQLYDKQTRQIEEMRALAQVSEVVTSPQYLDDILDVVTEMAAKMMDTAVCAIFLLNDAGTHLELRSARRDQTAYEHRPPLPTSAIHSVIGTVLHTGQPIYIGNVQSDPRYQGQALARQEGLVSLLSVPLSVRDRVIGVFNCYTTESRQFTTEQQTLFATLANQTALAIENARLVTNTAVVREMHHRIKNNLQTVAMLMQLQLGDADRLDTREVLQTNIHRIRSIAAVHEILSEKGFRLVDVKDVLERITRTTAETMTPPGQSLTIRVFGEALTLPSKPATAIALVVNELVQNSLEHAFGVQSVPGHIEVSLGRSPEQIIIIVRDNGRGLPTNVTPGLGLEIVETLVQEDLNGRLKFNRPPNGGTEISLRLPRTIEQEIG